MEAMGPGELCKYLCLAKPRLLQTTLQLAQEWEDVTAEDSSTQPQPTVQWAKQEESDATQRLTETMRDIVAIQQTMIEWSGPPQPPGPHLCWECGQPGHIRTYCPRQVPQPKNHQSPAGNGRGPRMPPLLLWTNSGNVKNLCQIAATPAGLASPQLRSWTLGHCALQILWGQKETEGDKGANGVDGKDGLMVCVPFSYYLKAAAKATRIQT
ncbi:UNVERIFIED_CONTAM: hypothetical protein FKN15_062051 [Acipenser sinensis]